MCVQRRWATWLGPQSNEKRNANKYWRQSHIDGTVENTIAIVAIQSAQKLQLIQRRRRSKNAGDSNKEGG
jgi:hypothetical protein